MELMRAAIAALAVLGYGALVAALGVSLAAGDGSEVGWILVGPLPFAWLTDTTSLIFDTAFASDFPADVPHIRWVIIQSRRAQVGGWIDRFCDATRT
jgi:hypothetical protein